MDTREIIASLTGRFGTRIWDVTQKRKRIYLSMDPKDIREAVSFLFNDLGMRFNIASAVDDFDAFEILYHFAKDADGIVVSVRVFLKDKKSPRIDSILPLMRGAEWIEREIHELFGIEFTGHPNMKPLLLPDDWPQGVFPLRKDFVPPTREDRKEL